MENNIIEKSNVLNAMQQTNYDMTLNEFRFFCMYLSKLNARDPSNRTAIIKIEDFEKLFDTPFNTSRFNKKIRQVAGANIEIKTGDKTTILQLYSKFEWCDSEDCKELEITCNFDVQPYLFELQKNYTAYRLGNIAKLNSIPKIRLYELCKQYEKIKEVKFGIEELQQMLMTKRNRFNDFRLQVIEPAVEDINKFTDITVTYEKILKCRKCVAIKFFIESKNQDIAEIEHKEAVPQKKDLKDLYNKYFSSEHEENFKSNIKIMLQEIYETDSMIDSRTDAIYKKCVVKFKMQAQSTEIIKPLSYMNGIINNLIDEESKNPKSEQSYNINEFERYAINYKDYQKSENTQEPLMPDDSESAEEAVITYGNMHKTVDEPQNADTVDNISWVGKLDISKVLCAKTAEEAIIYMTKTFPDWYQCSDLCQILKAKQSQIANL